MEKKKLLLTFKNQQGRNVSLAIDDPREDLTPEIVKASMTDIVSQNIFESSGGELALIVGAKVITTTNVNIF